MSEPVNEILIKRCSAAVEEMKVLRKKRDDLWKTVIEGPGKIEEYDKQIKEKRNDLGKLKKEIIDKLESIINTKSLRDYLETLSQPMGM